MFTLNLIILFLGINCALCQPVASLVDDDPGQNNFELSGLDVSQKTDFNGDRLARHIGAGGVFSGFGVFGGSGFASPVYATPSVSVVSAAPVVTTIPVISTLPSYPVYGGYDSYGGGYSGGLGGFGTGFGVAKFRAKGFGVGGGFFG